MHSCHINLDRFERNQNVFAAECVDSHSLRMFCMRSYISSSPRGYCSEKETNIFLLKCLTFLISGWIKKCRRRAYIYGASGSIHQTVTHSQNEPSSSSTFAVDTPTCGTPSHRFAPLDCDAVFIECVGPFLISTPYFSIVFSCIKIFYKVLNGKNIVVNSRHNRIFETESRAIDIVHSLKWKDSEQARTRWAPIHSHRFDNRSGAAEML